MQNSNKVKGEKDQKNNNLLQIFSQKYYPILQMFALSQLGVLLTVQSTKNLQISNVLSSSIIGLFFSLQLNKNADLLFSATFSGMSSLNVFHNNMWFAVFTGFIHTILFIFAKPYFIGFGGKLGTIGMISCIIGAFLPYIIYGSEYTYPIHKEELYDAKEIEENYYLYPIFACLGSVLTYLSKKYTNIKGNAVNASCVVGLISCFGIAIIYNNYTSKLAPVMFVGSFVGMSGDKILQNGIIDFTIAGIISGFILQGFNGTFLVGGKYGFSAFLSVVIYFYVKKGIMKVLKKQDNKQDVYDVEKQKQNFDSNSYISQQKADPISNQKTMSTELKYKQQHKNSLVQEDSDKKQ